MLREIWVIAAKEFRDSITSRRFLIVLAILTIISLLGIISGLNNYNTILNSYKGVTGSTDYQVMADQVRQQITIAEASNASAEEISNLKAQLAAMLNPTMPSVLLIFDSLNSNITFIGMVLAISVGFDLISKEIEEGSLKMLLSHPVHRDSIITGKIIGAILLLLTVLAVIYAMTIATMLIYGIVPIPDDIARIAVSLFIALLYLTLFLTIAVATSTLTRNSSTSILTALGIAFLVMAIPVVANFIVEINGGTVADYGSATAYNSVQGIVNDMIFKSAPADNFGSISRILFLESADNGMNEPTSSILQILLSMVNNIIVFIVEIALVLFVIYKKFMRVDIN